MLTLALTGTVRRRSIRIRRCLSRSGFPVELRLAWVEIRARLESQHAAAPTCLPISAGCSFLAAVVSLIVTVQPLRVRGSAQADCTTIHGIDLPRQ